MPTVSEPEFAERRATGLFNPGTFAEEVFAPVIVRPEQFQQLWSGTRSRSPEQQLALAVLEQAMSDLHQYRHARRRKRQRLYMEAYQWVASDERSWPYSFVNICESLNLAYDSIRAELLSDRVRAFAEAA